MVLRFRCYFTGRVVELCIRSCRAAHRWLPGHQTLIPKRCASGDHRLDALPKARVSFQSGHLRATNCSENTLVSLESIQYGMHIFILAYHTHYTTSSVVLSRMYTIIKYCIFVLPRSNRVKSKNRPPSGAKWIRPIVHFQRVSIDPGRGLFIAYALL